MDSDDEMAWSIHDLDHAPGSFHPFHRRTASASSSLSPNNRTRTVSLDLPTGIGSSLHHNRTNATVEVIPNRPRIWSASSVPVLPTFSQSNPASAFPPVENLQQQQQRIKKHSLRSILSQRSVAHIPETDDDDDVGGGGDLGQVQQIRRTMSDHEVVTGRRARSRSKDGERSQRSDRNELGSQKEEEDSFCTESFHLDEEAQEERENEDSFNIPDSQPIIIWGFQLPAWCSKGKRPGWDRVAAFVVTKAPCFLCYKFKDRTDRAILQRLNILCAVMALGQVLSALWLVLEFFVRGPSIQAAPLDGDTAGEGSNRFELVTSLWNINGSIIILGFLSTLIFTLNVVTIPMIRRVNLMGAVRYLWALLWVLPFEIHSCIGLFDYFRVTSVWLKHWWRDETVAPLRRAFCEPSDTYNKECAAPIRNVTDWCEQNYNSTECASIRDTAQSEAESFMLTYYYINAAWGVIFLFLLLLTVNTLERIISRPIVQKSRESNVPAWFSLPMIGCIAIGLLYTFSTSSVLSTRSGNNTLAWIGPFYIATAGLFLLASVLGWFLSSYSILSARHKRYKLVAVVLFILVMVGVLAFLIAIFSGSIAFSLSLVEFPISQSERGDIACFIDEANTCTNCENGFGPTKCPEWTKEDVTMILQTQAKAGAALSAIFLIYPISALRFGFNLRKYILLYQIEYV